MTTRPPETIAEPEVKQLLYFAGEPALNPTGMPSGEDSREFQR
jgi:hypothetical protein